jgi:hypothetical protein
VKFGVPVRFVVHEYYGTENPRDDVVFRAFIYWMEGGIEHERSFSVEELEAHIASCKAEGEPTDQLERALVRLRRITRPDRRVGARAT